jgi:hypothetical protein
MASAASLRTLPLELQEQVIRKLEFPDIIFLRMTCRHFNNIVKPLTHAELLVAERTEVTIWKDLYACRYCLRLRPASKFADKMLKKKRRQSGCDSSNRFCVECGIKSGPGITRYTRGSQIIVQGVSHVICIRCGEFEEGGVDNGKNTSECLNCWARTKAYRDGLREREELFQRTQERARLRAKRIARRAGRRENLGSSSEDSDELSASPTWSEVHMAMIQSEANEYMNSPKAGSE